MLLSTRFEGLMPLQFRIKCLSVTGMCTHRQSPNFMCITAADECLRW